jgi:hypothetical protein
MMNGIKDATRALMEAQVQLTVDTAFIIAKIQQSLLERTKSTGPHISAPFNTTAQ